MLLTFVDDGVKNTLHLTDQIFEGMEKKIKLVTAFYNEPYKMFQGCHK